MSILDQLSSQTGDRTEYSNRRVAIQCQDDPDLLADIVAGLRNLEVAIVGDCAEVLTKVAEAQPDLVASSAGALVPLLSSRKTRVRWEAMHALALVSHLAPGTIDTALPQLSEILRTDKSVIVRDYATDALAGYAATSETAARAAYPLLKMMLTSWNGKQAGHALQGMRNVAAQAPALLPELRITAQEYLSFPRAVVRMAAKSLQKTLASLS